MLPTDLVFIDRWHSYNVIKGEPRKNGSPISPVQSSTVIFEYDNVKDDKPYKDTVKETWKEVSTATLSVTTKGMIVSLITHSYKLDELEAASIELKQSIEIPEVGGSEFGISVSTEATDSESKQSEYTLSHEWDIVFVLYLPCYLYNSLIPRL